MHLITRQILIITMFSSLLPFGYVAAEMKSLSDNDLSEVDGAGIGLVMDSFVFSHGNDVANDKIFKITGLTDTNGDPVVINVNQLYIAGSGSNYGTTLDPVNLGRLTNPYEIDLIDGDTVGLAGESVLQLSAPEKVAVAGSGYSCVDPTLGSNSGDCSSRPSSVGWVNGERPDLGLELGINVGANTKNLNFNAKSAVFDGSYVRLWGDDSSQKMAAEFRMNFYTPELEISTCAQSNQGCGSGIKMQGFQLELALGTTFQPLYMGVDNVTGGLTFEIAKITHEYLDNLNAGVSDGTLNGDEAHAFFTDYYSNDSYRSNVVIDTLEVSGTSLGSAKIEGMLIQYLDVKFRDLAL